MVLFQQLTSGGPGMSTSNEQQVQKQDKIQGSLMISSWNRPTKAFWKSICK